MIKEIRFRTKVQFVENVGPSIVEDFLGDLIDEEVSVIVRRIPKKTILEAMRK